MTGDRSLEGLPFGLLWWPTGMKTRVKHLVLFSLLLLACGGGCMTAALWQSDGFEAYKQPANNLNLRLFGAQPQTNLLAVYDESSERNSEVHTRAYWINESQKLVDRRRCPHFIRSRSARHLPAVPVYYDPVSAGHELPPELCALVATNKQSFTLYLNHRAIASHDLPVYNDGKGRVEKIFLTPLAVAGDLTIVGSVIAYAYLWDADQDPDPPPNLHGHH
jgi:hypothetical protein